MGIHNVCFCGEIRDTYLDTPLRAPSKQQDQGLFVQNIVSLINLLMTNLLIAVNCCC